MRAAQVIASDLRSIGIPVQVKTRVVGAWFDRLSSVSLSSRSASADDRGSLYQYYKWLMSEETVKPIGEAAVGNFHRFGDREVDQWLEQLKRGADQHIERALNQKLQRRYAELAPVIPLFPNPQWGAASTRRAQGFPSAASPYAPLSPAVSPSVSWC